MTRLDYIFAALMGSACVVLIVFLTSMSVTWGGLISSDDFWGQSNATAIAYMLIYHSIGVALAALPIGLANSWRYRDQWFWPAMIASLVGSSCMLFDQLRGVWFLSRHAITPDVYHVASGVTDIVKVAVILLIVVEIFFGRVFAGREA